MIIESLDEIIKAEQKAREIVLNAQEEAKKISISTMAEIDALKEEVRVKVRTQVKKILDDAMREASVITAQVGKQSVLDAEALIKADERIVTKSAEYIADLITKSTEGKK